MLDQKDMAASRDAIRPTRRCATTDGALRADFVEQVRAGDRGAGCRGAARPRRRPAPGRRRRSPRGARSRAAAAPDRADGRRLRLHGAHRGRRHGARGDPRGTAGARPSPRASASSTPTTPSTSSRTCRKQEQAEILEQLPPLERVRARAQPLLSGRLRRPAHADRVHRGAAVLDRRARPSTTCARPTTCRTRFYELYVVDPGATGFSARSRSTGCCAPSGRCRSPS